MFYRCLVLICLLPTFAFSYTVVRKDGKIFSGELIQQNPGYTILKDKQGITIKFQAHQIDWDRTTQALQQEEARSSQAAVVRRQEYVPREISKRRQWTGEPLSFDFKDIDIKDVFRFIADISGLNVILDPAVHGSITLKLNDVPWDQALDLITKNEGLDYTLEGNVIRIAPISKIIQEERAQNEAAKEKFLSAPLVTRIKRLSYAKATQMEPIVRKLLTPKGSVIVDARTNTLIITDVESNIEPVSGMIDGLN